MALSLHAVVQNLVALVKYGVLLVVIVAAFKFLCRDMNSVASDDPGMRPAIGSTRTWLGYDREAWGESDVAVGDIVLAYAEAGSDARAFPFRVVAVGGDWMKIDGGMAIRYKDVNDQQNLVENYPGAEIRTSTSIPAVPRFQVPRGYVYLLSDNRANGLVAGPGLVPVYRLIGKAKL
ncbi:MAG TPA: S26 family signal peptidase [Planctomycetota bacterium]|nr:S26 family signal peptidase [Planctomycetota bacterium]